MPSARDSTAVAVNPGDLAQQPEYVDQIPADVRQEAQTPRIAALRRRSGYSAESAPGCQMRRVFTQSLRQVFLGELLQVDGEFLLEIVLHPRGFEDGSK